MDGHDVREQASRHGPAPELDLISTTSSTDVGDIIRSISIFTSTNTILQNGERVLAKSLLHYDRADFVASWSILISIIVVGVVSAAAWFFSPKGENQAYALLRSPPLHTHNTNESAASGDPPSSSLQQRVGSCGVKQQSPKTMGGSSLTCDLAITFLAQWHPLIAPERKDLRQEFNQDALGRRSFL